MYLHMVASDSTIGLRIEGHNNRYFQSDSYIVSEKGAAFTRLGTFEVIDPENPAVIRTYDLTAIERALWHAKRLDDPYTLDIENSLNHIYRICGKERRHFLPIFVSQIPDEKIVFEIVKAQNYSLEILNELRSFKDKTFTDNVDVEKQYQEMERSAKFLDSRKQSHNKLVSYEDAKKSLQFNFSLRKISESTAVIQVQMINPFPKRGELFSVVYLPVANVEKPGVKYLSEQVVGHVFKFKTEYMLVKNLTECHYKEDVFYCENKNVQVVSSFSYDYCLVGILKNNRADCTYEESQSEFRKFVHLGSDNFYFIQPLETNYVYECKYVVQKGVLHGTGVFTVQENCKLTTDCYSIENNDGLLEEVTLNRNYHERVSMMGFSLFVVSTGVVVLSMMTIFVLSIFKAFQKPKYSILVL